MTDQTIAGVTQTVCALRCFSGATMPERLRSGNAQLTDLAYRTLLVLSFVCLVPACGGGAPDDTSAAGVTSAPPAPGQPSSDPCSLVTSEEAGKALGAPVGNPERPKEANIPPRLTTCRYVAQRGQGVAVMSIMVRRSDSGSEARAGFRAAREQFPQAETVPGLGDESFWFANQLNVLSGTVYLNITGDFDRAAAESLGQSALTRLE